MNDQFKKNILTYEFPDIVGLQEPKEQLKGALLAKRNIILLGPPGVGKTSLAKSISSLLGDVELTNDAFRSAPSGDKPTRIFSGEERFIRVQGSPDLTAEDLLGDIDPIKAMKFGPLSLEAFTPGKIFRANNGILFFDEINRCSDKLQNALLQVLQEKSVTIGSYSVDFPADFFFIGTMNPDDSSTETLSKVFLDRFDIIPVGYPATPNDEMQIVDANAHLTAQLPKELQEHIVAFIRSLRAHPQVESAPSVRASLGLAERSTARACLFGRDVATIEDIAKVVSSVLSHRVELKPSVRYTKSIEEFIGEVFAGYCDRNRLQIGSGG